ncbi:MAG: DUF1853 family protein [gamma proteobacterium symbiont of Bathyaustriella thionipta]|nr:DUF1853 family protein [gamma proteobacterium symbiont of Bathyaustriella thionipta]MCU7951191.1 DUF1853 family protein [gamma proteobacterium symbiont of Bathyaustriella thionipta]MCU7954565.1 DUF1853 family protein [gamma proteobacterium symbiont of Bathyaustriella thionipta]MCU7957697.1 DUF1853 family protein [gamma proteobacterium symbiont of Bathyaustriella thionipta]MCU7967982.1 DUF1853 family protein [gamma proteobacterium symbiont of Bathyaustriella thionipta]
MQNILTYSQYKDPQVRALVWSLLSPGLVNESGHYPACVSRQWCHEIYDIIQTFLQQLDNDPTELRQWLEQFKSWRLGIRFEAYWAFIFEQLTKQKVILSYISHTQVQEQINNGPFKHTLGEMDFVYQDKNEQLNHLEIASKFYLLKPDEFGFERLIGPNGGDWYERKLEHLFKKQLPLSNRSEAKEILAENFNLNVENVNCQHQGIIKGMIFLPVTGEGRLNDNEMKCLDPDCLMGTWGTINNWYLSDPGEVGRWVMLDKLSWLEPQFFSTQVETLYTAKEMAYKLKTHFHSTIRSVLIAHVEYDEEHKLWLEQQRVMVVDKYWPSFKRTIDTMIEQSEIRPKDKKQEK